MNRPTVLLHWRQNQQYNRNCSIDSNTTALPSNTTAPIIDTKAIAPTKLHYFEQERPGPTERRNKDTQRDTARQRQAKKRKHDEKDKEVKMT